MFVGSTTTNASQLTTKQKGSCFMFWGGNPTHTITKSTKHNNFIIFKANQHKYEVFMFPGDTPTNITTLAKDKQYLLMFLKARKPMWSFHLLRWHAKESNNKSYQTINRPSYFRGRSCRSSRGIVVVVIVAVTRPPTPIHTHPCPATPSHTDKVRSGEVGCGWVWAGLGVAGGFWTSAEHW